MSDLPLSERERKLCEALMFYANPESYFAIGFFPDNPAGEFMDDFSETDLGEKPGKLARETLEKYEKCIWDSSPPKEKGTK